MSARVRRILETALDCDDLPRSAKFYKALLGVAPMLDTERLVDSIAQFVTANGAKFFVGLQSEDKELISHLQERRIPFVSLDGAPFYPGASVGGHWTPEGQKMVADRFFDLLSASKAIPAN